MYAPRITPSASNAMRTSPCSCRDLPAASRFSLRSSTHFSGAPTFRPASMMHISSRCTITFWPKPPPVSRITTRTFCSGTPSRRAQNSADLVRHLGRGDDRDVAGRRVAVDDEPASFERRRDVRLLVDRLARDVGGFGEDRVERRRRPARELADDVGSVVGVHEDVVALGDGVVDDRRQRLVVDVDQLGCIFGLRTRLGDTSATGSPTNRASPSASGGRGVSGLSLPIAVCHCSLASPLRSAAVNTNRTPGACCASLVSMPRIAARANGLRTKNACSMPGRTTSSTYVPRPVRRRASSTRLTRAPTYRPAWASPAGACVLTRSRQSGRRRPGSPRR